MKTIFASFGWLLLLLPIIGIARTKTLTDIHNISSEERPVSGFTGISSSGSWHIHVTMGGTENLRIEGDDDVIKYIETKVEGGTLKIRSTKKSNTWSWGSNDKVDIFITAKALKDLSLSGSGRIEVTGLLKGSTTNAQVSGSGGISMELQSANLNASISGSGNIKVRGAVSVANISVSGSGSFRGGDLKATTAQANVSGSGGAEIHVEETLNAALSGSGSIRYSGNAKVNEKKSGSGRIVKI